MHAALEHDAGEAKARRARAWLVAGLSGLLAAIALSLGSSGAFAPTLALVSVGAAALGLHRFGRSGNGGGASA